MVDASVSYKSLIKTAVLLIAMLICCLIPGEYVSAATGKIYTSPSAGSVRQGSEISIAVRIDPGTGIEGVQGSVSYDAGKLQIVSVDDSSSAFPVVIEQNHETNPITFTRATSVGQISSDALILTLRFKALAGSGSTTLSIAGNASSGGAPTNPNIEGGTIQFSAAQQHQSNPSPGTGSSTSGQPGSNQNQNGTPDNLDSNDADNPVPSGSEPPVNSDSGQESVMSTIPTRNNNLVLWLTIAAGGLVITGAGYVIIRRRLAAADELPPAVASPVTYNEDMPHATSHVPADPKLQQTLEHLPGVQNPEPGSTINPEPKDRYDT